jgi:hypothetical protein
MSRIIPCRADLPGAQRSRTDIWTSCSRLQRHGTRIDIHLHDGGSPGTWHLELIMEGPGRPDSAAGPQSATRTAWYRPIRPPRTASPGNWPMRGQPRHRRRVQPPVLAIVRLRAAGVTIACGHDGTGDLWSPWCQGGWFTGTRTSRASAATVAVKSRRASPWLTVRLPASARLRLTLPLTLRTRPPSYATPFGTARP